jgi:hypothetical protein
MAIAFVVGSAAADVHITHASDASTDTFFGLKIEFDVFVTGAMCQKQGQGLCTKQGNPLVQTLQGAHSFKMRLAEALVKRKLVEMGDAKVCRLWM